MKKLNKKVLAGAGLGVMALVGGTFAYYNQTVSLENPLNTGKYENELVEEFTPPTEVLKPGATIDKEVGARNTGDYPVMVRIKMDETWKRALRDEAGELTGEIKDIIGQHSTEKDTFEAVAGKAGEEYITAQQDNDTDGKTDSDGSVVRKNLTSESDWIYNENDGYWYFNGVLDKDDTTGPLLDSITLATNVDLGLYETKDWYYVGTDQPEADSNNWIPYVVTRNSDGEVTKITIDGKEVGDLNTDGFINAIDMAKHLNVTGKNSLFRKNESLLNKDYMGYADANYTLKVTSQFVQATPNALKEAFTTEEVPFENLPQEIQDVINGIDLNN